MCDCFINLRLSRSSAWFFAHWQKSLFFCSCSQCKKKIVSVRSQLPQYRLNRQQQQQQRQKQSAEKKKLYCQNLYTSLRYWKTGQTSRMKKKNVCRNKSEMHWELHNNNDNKKKSLARCKFEKFLLTKTRTTYTCFALCRIYVTVSCVIKNRTISISYFTTSTVLHFSDSAFLLLLLLLQFFISLFFVLLFSFNSHSHCFEQHANAIRDEWNNERWNEREKNKTPYTLETVVMELSRSVQ